jgi:hypothetical protein
MKQSCLTNTQAHVNGYSFTRLLVNSLTHLRMKSILKSVWLISIISLLFSCSEEELRVHYPYSLPTISNVTVLETEIVYGDSITVGVEVADPVTPLSTMEIKIVVNDVIVNRETLRTKGNSASYNQRYKVPFGPYMPNGSAVEVHLSSINVEGNHTEQVVATTIGTRPEIPLVYLVLTAGGATKLNRTDAENEIYSANNLPFKNEISFYLAEKVTRFGNVDWSGIVFGDVNGELGLIEQGGTPYTLSDLTRIGFTSITLDLLNFTVSGDGEKLMPVTEIDFNSLNPVQLTSTNHLNESTSEAWKKTQLYFGKDTEIKVTGVTDVATGFTPDFFETTGTNTVKFLGETGVYTVYYLPSADYVYVEQPTALYPDALWLDGVGFGRPQAPYQKTSSWNWNTPLEYIFCRKISPGVFQATVYAEHEVNTEAEEDDRWRYTFSVKFFHQRGWGDEIDARQYAIPTPLLSAPTDKDVGNFVGTSNLTTAAGAYCFTIDTNNKSITFEKKN